VARKRRNFDLGGNTDEPTVRSTAELNAPAEKPSDLLSAWRGQTRDFADQRVPDVEGDSAELFAQLRTIADDLAQPASRVAPRMLGSGDADAVLDSGFGTDGAPPSSYDGEYAASPGDLSILREYIDRAERRLASIIADSQHSVAEGLRESRERMEEALAVQPAGSMQPANVSVDIAGVNAAIAESETRLLNCVTEAISRAMTANQESLAAELRASHERMTSALESNHAPVEVGLVALLESLETVERRLAGRVSEREGNAAESHRILVDELRGVQSHITTSLESQVGRVVAGHGRMLAESEERIMAAVRREITQAMAERAPDSDALRAMLVESTGAVRKLEGEVSASRDTLHDRIADVKSIVETQVGAIAEQTRGLKEQLSAGEVSRLPALFHDLRADLEVSEAELVAAANREEDVRADAARRESEALEAENAAALQRAIGMLSVLESLDEVVAGLQGRSDSESLKRLQHFERETRAMARLVELEDIPADGMMDAERHEVVSTVRANAARGTILDLRQRGYSFRGRVVRPAQVIAAE
jgi:molecular chaperone GrpE (heat shock protein)